MVLFFASDHKTDTQPELQSPLVDLDDTGNDRHTLLLSFLEKIGEYLRSQPFWVVRNQMQAKRIEVFLRSNNTPIADVTPVHNNDPVDGGIEVEEIRLLLLSR